MVHNKEINIGTSYTSGVTLGVTEQYKIVKSQYILA
jgi:hypothetical protein